MGIHETRGNDLPFTVNDFRGTARRIYVLPYIGDGIVANQNICIVEGYDVVVLVMSEHRPTPKENRC